MDQVTITKLNCGVRARWRMTDEGWVVDVVVRHRDKPTVEVLSLAPEAAAELAGELVSAPAESNGHVAEAR